MRRNKEELKINFEYIKDLGFEAGDRVAITYGDERHEGMLELMTNDIGVYETSIKRYRYPILWVKNGKIKLEMK